MPPSVFLPTVCMFVYLFLSAYQLMGFLLMITLTFDVFLGFLMLRKVEKCTKLALEIGKSRGSLMMVKLSTRHTQQSGQHSMAQVYGMLHKVSPSSMLDVSLLCSILSSAFMYIHTLHRLLPIKALK